MQQIPKRLAIGLLFATFQACLSAANTAPSPGTESSSDTGVIRFDIQRFEVSDNTLLNPTLVDDLLRPFTGKSRDFADIQKALEALEAAFHQRGYSIVQVELPEQELNLGVVHLRVVQPRIGKIIVEGNRQFSSANIAQSMPNLQLAQTLNLWRVSTNLKVVNENPAKKLTLQLESSDVDEEVNALLKVTESSVWKLGASVDNTGTSETGKTQATFSIQHANVFDLDHVLSLQYSTTLEKPNQVSVYALGYHIPLYAMGDSMDLYGSYSNVDSGTLSTGLVNLQVNGKGRVWGARYNHNLPKNGDYESRLVFGLDSKAFVNNVLLTGQQLGHDITVRPISLGYSGAWTLAKAEANFSASVLRNISGGNQGSSADFKAARLGANPDYLLLRYTANYSQLLMQDWQVRLGLAGQYTQDALIPGEQWGAGGASSVRGFSEREQTNDYGMQINAEFLTPNLCGDIQGIATQCRALVFYDAAQLERNMALPGEITRSNLSSVGLGVRVAASRYLSMQMDYGHGLNGSEGSNKDRLHFKLYLSY